MSAIVMGNSHSSQDRLEQADYSYDADGRLVAVRDSAGTTYFTYDSKGRLISTVAPDGSTVGYHYDSDDECR